MLNEASDGAETVAWIARQPWSTGQVGTFGGSYLGFTQWHLARERPPALRVMAPLVTTSDYYRAPWRHTGGVFGLGISLLWSLSMASEEVQRQVRQGKASREQVEALLQMMSQGTPPYEHLPLVDMPLLREFAPYYLEWLAHPTYDDYWQDLAHSTFYEQVTVPALHIGGWYDLFLGPTLENYTGMKRRGGSALARQHQRLLIGPWSHGSWTGVFPQRSCGTLYGLSTNPST